MVAQRQRATFEPISPDLDVRALVETTENFQYVDRISCEMIQDQGIEQFDRLVLLHVIIGGKPLVVDGFERYLDPWTFTQKWLRDNHGGDVVNARSLQEKDNLRLTIAHYLRNMSLLTDQFFKGPNVYKDPKRQRMYLKDIDCPPVWHDKLREHIPASLTYLNESTGEIGGPGSVMEPIPNAAGQRQGRGIAIAGDLMSCLPTEMRAENLMCYIGHEGTYTPAHREMCATMGHNIMVEASGTINEDGQPEKPGSSLWFMTESKDRKVVQEYWLSVLGHDIEVENHFAQITAWKKAPFKTYIVEQKAGDFILIPPLAPHQVWNRGTRTMKVAWNRTTIETLEMALEEALPNARMVCRDEQYKNKAIVYYTLVKYSGLLKRARIQIAKGGEEAIAVTRSKRVKQVQKDFKRLFELYKRILLSEMFDPEGPKEHPQYLPYDSCVTCAYCRGNIFNRFLTCKYCVFALGTETEEPYDVCMDCYAMGRSCGCISKLQWVEQWKWRDLVHMYDEWRRQIIEIDGGFSAKTPQLLIEERKLYPNRTLAQVCQEQLRLRPWVDYKNPQALKEQEEDSEEEIPVNDDGTLKKTKPKRSKTWAKNNIGCHVCFHRHPRWKVALCSMCNRAWCYGALWRAHDLMPQDVMQDPNWECPHCRKVCSTGACRKDPRMRPYEPKGTLLGHDTKKVADQRSVECLVDFSASNLNWVKDGEAPIARRREEAERAKENGDTLNALYADDEDAQHEIDYSMTGTPIGPIDPALGGDGVASVSAIPNGGRPNGDDSPHQNVLVAPSAVMWQSPEDDQNGFTYPDPDDLDLDGNFGEPSASRKRARQEDSDDEIMLSKPKKRKGIRAEKAAQAAKKKAAKEKESLATQQFKFQQQKELIDKAKREGRYISVMARMKGKKKIVKLKVDKQKLAEIISHPPGRSGNYLRPLQRPENAAPAEESNILLRSDVVDVNKNKTGPPQAPNYKPKKLVQQSRYDAEDEDYYKTTRIGRNKLASQTKSKKTYEEIDVDSEEDEEPLDVELEYTAPTSTETSTRRQSNWLARRNQDEGDDLPDELPSDFKDGAVNRRKRERNRRTTLPKAQIRPKTGRPGRPGRPRASTGNVRLNGGEDAGFESDPEEAAPAVQKSSVFDSAAMADKARAAAALLEEDPQIEENRRAKLAAASWALDGTFDDSLSISPSPSPSPEPPTKKIASPAAKPFGKPVNGQPKAGPGRPPATIKSTAGLGPSILSRAGPSGKKVRIVSTATAAAKRAAATAGAANGAPKVVVQQQRGAPNRASVGKQMQVTEISSDESSSDDDSADEIPARKAPTTPVKVGPGRPSLRNVVGLKG